MTLQTDAPLVHMSLSPNNRPWRHVVSLAAEGWLVLDPPYQRASVWTLDQRRNLVRSSLLGVPIPAIIVNDRCTRGWRANMGESPLDTGSGLYAVIDGKQRAETVIAWMHSEFTVPASWFDPDWVETTEDTDDGPYVRYSGLTRKGQRLFDNRAILPQIEAQMPSLAAEADLYLLVNTGGTAQSEQDLTNAANFASEM